MRKKKHLQLITHSINNCLHVFDVNNKFTLNSICKSFKSEEGSATLNASLQ